MNLKKLKEKTYDSSYPLDDLLLEFRYIAKKTKNEVFLTWINNELNGYNKKDTPKYRILKNSILFFMATDGYRVLTSKASIQRLKAEKDNEKEFIEDVSNIKVNNSLAEIQEFSKKDKEFTAIPEQGFSYLIDQLLTGGSVQSFHMVIQPGQYKYILNSIRMLLQDFIEELDKITDWEDNDLSSILMDKTFSVVIYKTINNYTNNIEKSNNSVINTGNGSTVTASYNDNIIKECFDIVNSIKTNNKDIEDLKLELIRALKECEQEKLNSKPTILGKLCTIIITSAAVTADVATSMPLFTPLLTYLRG